MRGTAQDVDQHLETRELAQPVHDAKLNFWMHSFPSAVSSSKLCVKLEPPTRMRVCIRLRDPHMVKAQWRMLTF